jgi:hypothetical protein
MSYELDVVRPANENVFTQVPESKWKARAREAAKQFPITGRHIYIFDDAAGVALVANREKNPTAWHYMVDGQVVRTYRMKNLEVLDTDLVAEV